MTNKIGMLSHASFSLEGMQVNFGKIMQVLTRGHCMAKSKRGSKMEVGAHTACMYTACSEYWSRSVSHTEQHVMASNIQHSSPTKLTFESYADCLITSGAIQKGVPTNVCRLLVVLVSCPATPKSASLTSPPSDKSTFAAESRPSTPGGVT